MCLWHKDYWGLTIFERLQTQENLCKQKLPFWKTIYIYKRNHDSYPEEKEG